MHLQLNSEVRDRREIRGFFGLGHDGLGRKLRNLGDARGGARGEVGIAGGGWQRVKNCSTEVLNLKHDLKTARNRRIRPKTLLK